MIKVGITGQAGFIGSHLYQTLNLHKESYECVPFLDEYFEDDTKLISFAKQCDAIVHLAAMNRHEDPNVIYETNLALVKKLISACEASQSKPHILFSSSTQEERENQYGKSKKEGRILLEQWATKNKANLSALVIPNVFGPFGRPYYNSVVATFCHQLTHNETPKIEIDAEIKLIYVGHLVNHFIERITGVHKRNQSGNKVETINIAHTAEAKVSTILSVLQHYKKQYLDQGEMPNLDNPFHRELFCTFMTYIDYPTFFPFLLKKNTDERGSFVELIKLNSGGQISFSTTKPGITRGNHYHTRKSERFAVIKGKARIEIRRIGTDKVYSFELDGNSPSFVDMPIWFTHNITNVGDEELYTIFWINEHFNAEDPDTFFEKV